ncbi:MAG TPA: periplasmic heavy metal sensor [Vicinamibacterales bacterium]|nr:periplasmic heavy metal sensor [Vicinamibacterales bacterium]
MKILRKSFICLVLSLMVQAAATPALAQGFKWWQTERFKKELALTAEQINRIEGIYQTTEPLLRAQRKAVDKNDEKLSKIIADPKSDEPTVLQAVDRLEASRSEVSRTRTLFLFRIRRVLSDEQNVKINAMFRRDREERERRQNDHNNRDKTPNTKPKGDKDHSHHDGQ